MNKPHAIALISGGLDSTLAARLIIDQGIQVVGLHFTHPFIEFRTAEKNASPAQKAAKQLSIRLMEQDLGAEIFGVLKNPAHGFGKHMNPCIDCRIEQIKKAVRVMNDLGASFIVTGEVLGQRPMSQRRDAMNIVDRDSGCKSLVLRPLSAKLLASTIPEKSGLVDRERLMDIAGRGRKVQMAMAERYGITDYSSPAGGCLLTQERYAAKVADLVSHSSRVDRNDVAVLRLGRHFRLSEKAKAIVGKNDKDNKQLRDSAREDDLVIRTRGVPGPLTLVRGRPAPEDIRLAAALAAWYVKKAEGKVPMAVEDVSMQLKQELDVEPLSRVEIEELRI